MAKRKDMELNEVQDTPEQPAPVMVADDAQPVLSGSHVQAGYVELALKSGKGKTVIVPKTSMKYYPEDVWTIVTEGTTKKK